MKTIQEKLDVLSKIAKGLNSSKINWAVGASLLLYFKGIINNFNDIDLIVSEEDVVLLKEQLLKLGELLPTNLNVKYKTKHFLEFNILGVEVDVMAGFIIVNNNKEYYFPLSSSSVQNYVKINGEIIPLQSLDEWRTYYELMERFDKVQIIDKFFKKNNKSNK